MLSAGEGSACSTLIARYRRWARRYVQKATVRSIALKGFDESGNGLCARRNHDTP